MQLHKQPRPIQAGDRVLTHTGRLAFVLGGSRRLWEPRKVYSIVTREEILESCSNLEQEVDDLILELRRVGL